MGHFREFEEFVIDLLALGTLTPELIARVKKGAEFISYEPTGNGYFFKVGHPELPVERHMCTVPLVIGEAGGIRTAFVLYLQNHQMTIECHGFGDQEIPKSYREQNVRVTAS